jgi:UDP-N-acetylmuramate dehydrogenase
MLSRLAAIPNLKVSQNIPLASLTRFEIGGPALILADASTEASLAQALEVIRESKTPWTLIGGGSNLIVDDAGFPGVVLRYTASKTTITGETVKVESGAKLQDLVDLTIAQGLKGLETMTGIPGWVAGAIYGNAGAYGHSIDERIDRVRFFNGHEFLDIDNEACEFRYRESVFKRNKKWIIVSATLSLSPAIPAELQAKADSILAIRNEKYPPAMRCAGSIFKNLLLKDIPQVQVPPQVVREGKVPSAYFLEQAGAKGLQLGALRVADYHANLIYNEGSARSADLLRLIADLKSRVHSKFGLMLEEEVQYIGAAARTAT